MALLQRLRERIGGFKAEGSKALLSPREVRSFFEAQGIDIDSIGFPFMEHSRTLNRFEAYDVRFTDVTASPVLRDGTVKTSITGTYRAQARASHKDEDGFWQPGTPTTYSFSVEDGQLKLKRKR